VASGGFTPGAAGGATLGSAALPFSGIFVGGAATNNNEIVSAATTGARVFTLPDANSNSVQPLGSATAHQFVTFINSSGVQAKAQPNFTDIAGVIAPSQFVLGSANLTTQVANVAATTLFAVVTAGLYRISVYIVVSQVATVSGTLPDSRIIYTDQDSGATETIQATVGLTGNLLTTLAQVTIVVNAKASTNIQYDIGQVTTYASAGATPLQFAYRARVEYLG
jgi:hypothetical protein